MVNDGRNDAAAAERALVLSYAPAAARAGLAALLALDDRLRRITLAARDPMIGLMRLTWWADALAKLDDGAPPAEPLLRMLADDVLPHRVSGAALARLSTAWEIILDGDADWSEVARERAWLFRLGAEVLGASDPRVETFGIAWSRADLARDWPEASEPDAGSLSALYRQPWPRALRSLGALGLLARSDLAGGEPGDPRRVGRLLLHRLTGR